MPTAQMDAPDGKPSGSYGEGEAKKSKGPILTHDSSSARRASSVPYQESRSAKHRTGSVLKGLPRGAACLVLTCAGPSSPGGIDHRPCADPRASQGRLAEAGQDGAASRCPDLTECRSWLGPPLVPAHQPGQCAFPVGQRKEPRQQAQLPPMLSNCGNPSCSPGLI
jgi:hypothetical protein